MPAARCGIRLLREAFLQARTGRGRGAEWAALLASAAGLHRVLSRLVRVRLPGAAAFRLQQDQAPALPAAAGGSIRLNGEAQGRAQAIAVRCPDR